MGTINLRDAIRECPAGVTNLGVAGPLFADNRLLHSAIEEIEKRAVLLQWGEPMSSGEPMTACERLSLWLLAKLYEAKHGVLQSETPDGPA